MKYCIPYAKHSIYKNEIDEINIKYNHESAEELASLMQNFPNAKINIILDSLSLEEQSADFINFVVLKTKKDCINFSLVLRPLTPNHQELITKCKTYNIPFYSTFAANDWDTLRGLIDIGVSEVFITADLCFDLEAVSTFVHNNNVKIRVVPNICQSTWADTPSLKTFFIRPEDVDIYESYIDVLELDYRLSSIDTIYKIYAKDKKWIGDLQDLIIHFKDSLDNRFIPPGFAYFRLNCRKKCQQNDKCKICDGMIHLTETLKDKNIVINTSNK